METFVCKLLIKLKILKRFSIFPIALNTFQSAVLLDLVNSFIMLMYCIHHTQNFAVFVRFHKASLRFGDFSCNFFINSDISNFSDL